MHSPPRFPRLRDRLHQRAGLLSGGEQQILADRAYVMEAGRIVASGPAAAIAADGALEKAYLGAA